GWGGRGGGRGRWWGRSGDRSLVGWDGCRRVVVTGLGAVTPLADGVGLSWGRVVEGRSAAGPIGAFDASGFPVGFACEAKEFEPARWIVSRRARQMDRVAQLVVAGARQVEAGGGSEIGKEPERVGGAGARAMCGM